MHGLNVNRTCSYKRYVCDARTLTAAKQLLGPVLLLYTRYAIVILLLLVPQ